MDSFPPSTSGQQTPLQPQIVVEPPRRKSGWFVRLLMVFLVLGLLGSLALNMLLLVAFGLSGFTGDEEGRVLEKHYALNRHGPDKVAILSIEGTILSGEGFVKRQIDHARKDIEAGNLKAIVVRVNSPGGTLSGSDYILHHLRKLIAETHIPVVVSMGGLAASGGYYVSMCVGDRPDTIFAEPTTWTGSIGVLIPHYNFAELMEKWGIQEDPVVSHPMKTMGSMTRKMTPQEQKIFQALVEDGFARFKDAIQKGRPRFRNDPAALDKLATGQLFTAKQACDNGLVDDIGFVEKAIDRVILLAGLNKATVNVVKYKAEPTLADLLFGRSRVPSSLDMAALLDTTTPQAYYLCTWLPALAGSAKQEP